MTSYIKCLLDEMYDQDNKDEIKYLFCRFFRKDEERGGSCQREHAAKDFIEWVREKFDDAEVPKGAFRNILLGEFIFSPVRVEDFLNLIRDNIQNTEFD